MAVGQRIGSPSARSKTSDGWPSAPTRITPIPSTPTRTPAESAACGPARPGRRATTSDPSRRRFVGIAGTRARLLPAATPSRRGSQADSPDAIVGEAADVQVAFELTHRGARRTRLAARIPVALDDLRVLADLQHAAVVE